jgi:DNA-binding beta-propeller fold protein YncE
MRKLHFLKALLAIGIGCGSLESCSKNFVTAAATTSASIPNPLSLLSAYATIGTASNFESPAGIQYSNSHLWVANVSTFLQEWTMTGTAPVTTIWSYNSGVSFVWLWGDGVDPVTGNVYVCDPGNYQIAVFNPTGNYLAVFGNAQMSVTTTSYPTGVAVNSSGTTVYALSPYSGSIYVYSIGGTPTNPTYTYQSSFGNAGSGPATLNTPYNLRVDSAGNVWIADTGNHRLAEYGGTGTYSRSFKVSAVDTNFSPIDVLVDGSGNAYGVDSNANVVVKFNSSGTVLGQFGQGILSGPEGIATDGSGHFYVTDNNPQQIVAFH